MNNTCADQPARPRSLISTVVVRFWESIISGFVTREISVCVAEETGLSLAFSKPQRQVLSRRGPHGDMLASGQFLYIIFFFSTKLIAHTLSIISLLCAALRQNLALHLVIGVAGKPTTTVPSPPVNSEVLASGQFLYIIFSSLLSGCHIPYQSFLYCVQH